MDTLPSESGLSEIETDTPVIEETVAETFPALEADEQDGIATEDTPTIEMTVEDCEMVYGVVMETAHAMLGTKKGKSHRGLPEERRAAQGKLLHSICLKYGIVIPTEFELVILGGAAIADWQYMTVNEGDENVSNSQKA